MQQKAPQETRELHWTQNAIAQMRQYGISEQKVKTILARPSRIERGIAEGTIGAMIPFGSPTKDGRQPYRGEVWVLYAEKSKEKKARKSIIAVWKYPGVSKEREGVPMENESLIK